MYTAMDIAQYVINYSIDQNSPVSNLKLQKLLYYIQAAFLVESGEPCFEDDIKHWRHGPVVPNVYSEYKSYLDKDIKDKQNQHTELFLDENMNISFRRTKYSDENFLECDKKLMNEVIDSYKGICAWEMVDRTHQEDPWKKTFKDETISNDSIMEYFSLENMKDRIYGGV